MTDNSIKHVLAVGAHPDDIEISCAGTLARYVKDGTRVTILTLSSGDKGTFDLPAEEITKIRENECRAAAAVIDAEWIGFGIPDGTIIWDEKLHTRMIQAIQQAAPDLIITHSPDDYMSDHVETSKAVTSASFFTVCPQFCAEDGKPASIVVPVFFMDNICGVGFLPSEYVDITDTFDTKLAMYDKHESQHTYLAERQNQDFFEVIKTSARYRGLQCGVTYAEGFRRYEVSPRLSCERLLP
jgi:LmbE family N-acetylglucosaminyl deacetylase